MNERIVGVRELRTHLSEHLRRVKAGGTLLITERGDPIGRVVPVRAELDDRPREVVAAGLVSWSGSPLPPAPHTPAIRGERTVAALLLDDRR